jgi:hypothetical protein
VPGACECGNEHSGFIKCGDFLFVTSEEPVSFLRTTLFLGLNVRDVQVLKPSGRSALPLTGYTVETPLSNTHANFLTQVDLNCILLSSLGTETAYSIRRKKLRDGPWRSLGSTTRRGRNVPPHKI